MMYIESEGLIMITKFTCHICKQDKEHESDMTTGYGLDEHDNKICYACCGKQAEQRMRDSGRAALYLTENGQLVKSYTVSNWPGTLKIPCFRWSKGRHNIAGVRYDVWFRFDNQLWHGVTYGNNTQICHCKRLK